MVETAWNAIYHNQRCAITANVDVAAVLARLSRPLNDAQAGQLSTDRVGEVGHWRAGDVFAGYRCDGACYVYFLLTAIPHHNHIAQQLGVGVQLHVHVLRGTQLVVGKAHIANGELGADGHVQNKVPVKVGNRTRVRGFVYNGCPNDGLSLFVYHISLYALLFVVSLLGARAFRRDALGLAHYNGFAVDFVSNVLPCKNFADNVRYLFVACLNVYAAVHVHVFGVDDNRVARVFLQINDSLLHCDVPEIHRYHTRFG